MSNLVEKIEITRLVREDYSKRFEITLGKSVMIICTRFNANEYEAVIQLLDSYIRRYYIYLTSISLEQLRLKVVEGFHQLRENNLNGDSEDSMEIIVVPKEPPGRHSSCKMDQNENDTTKQSGANVIS